MAKSPLRRDAGRDTLWVGKGAGRPWLIAAAVGAGLVFPVLCSKHT